MKKVLAILLAVTMVLALVACGAQPAPAPAAAPASDNSSSTASSTTETAPAPAPQQTIKVRMAHTGTEASLSHRAMEVIGEYMEQESGGVFDVTIYPNGTIGNDAQLVEAVQEGDIEMMFTNTGNLTSFIPDLGVYALPFVFASNEEAYAVLDGEFGQKMLQTVTEKGNMIGLGYLEAVAFRQLSADRLIRVPADLNGVKIRVMTNPLHMAIWESLGAQPTPISFAELYTSLQQGTVNAQENPVELFISQAFYEVQPYLTLTNHVFTTGMFSANPDWFNGLSPELQQIIRDGTKKGVEFQRTAAKEEWDGWMQFLADHNITVTELTDEEYQLWVDGATPAVAVIREQVGSDLVDELYAAVEALR